MGLFARIAAFFAASPANPPPKSPFSPARLKPEVRALMLLGKLATARSGVKRKTSLPFRHQRAARIFRMNAKAVQIPAGFLARNAFFADPWWKASEAKLGEVAIPPGAPKLPDGSTLIEEKRHEVVLLDGRKVTQVRRVLADPQGRRRKEFLAEFADGTRTTFDHIRHSLLPLYVAPEFPLPEKGPVVVAEGVPAARALAAKRVPAVATLTGALGTPSHAALDLIVKHSPIVLWPDNDSVGAQHMQRVAQRLTGMGAKDVRVVRWVGGPRKADAADFTGTAEELQKLLDSASTWSPDSPVRSRGVLAVNAPRGGLRLRLSDSERPATRASAGRSKLLARIATNGARKD